MSSPAGAVSGTGANAATAAAHEASASMDRRLGRQLDMSETRTTGHATKRERGALACS
jgi:hypothetical protein